MAKCVHCGQKKGKRYCPALDDGICAQCCATHRLATIQCPADCVHLQSEFYQQGRRNQKAQSAGKKFVERTGNSFHSEEARSFAFMVQSDLYWWCARHGDLSNKELASALDASLLNSPGTDIDQGEKNDPADFLSQLFSRSSRYKELEKNGFDTDQKRKVLDSLANCARNHAENADATESQSFIKELKSYFDQLDFEADLDYSPLEELAEETDSPTKEDGDQDKESGLIIPGQ